MSSRSIQKTLTIFKMDPARALAQDSFKELFPYPESVISFSDFVLFDLLAATTEDRLITAFKMFDTIGEGHLSRGICRTPLIDRILS